LRRTRDCVPALIRRDRLRSTANCCHHRHSLHRILTHGRLLRDLHGVGPAEVAFATSCDLCTVVRRTRIESKHLSSR